MSNYANIFESQLINFLKNISEEFDIPYNKLYDFYRGNQVISDDEKAEIEPIVTKKSPEKKRVKIEDILMGKKKEEIKEEPKKKEEIKEEPKKKVSPKKEINVDSLKADPDLDPVKLNNYTLDELKGLCKRHSLKVSGKKIDLIKRLQGKEGEEEKVEENDTKTKISPEKRVTKKQEVKEDQILTEKISSKTPIIDIRKNKFGNFMHTTSLLVFDKNTKEAIGKQLDDGTLADLTPEDIDECNKYKFNYRLPENLDKNKKGLDDIKIAELEEKEIEVEVEEEVEEIYEEVEYEEEYEEES